MKNLIHLKSKHTSLIINTQNSPEIIHWGKRLNTGEAEIVLATDSAITQARLDVHVPISTLPGLGEGLFSAPGLEGNRQGLDWAPVFKLKEETVTNYSAHFVTIDTQANLEITILLELDQQTGVLKKRLILKNLGSTAYDVNKLATTIPVPRRCTELMSFHGRWSNEFQTQRRAFTHDSFVQENRRGRTSHENFPGLMVGSKGFSEEQGEVYGFHLGWSGNHQLRADVKSDGRRFVQAGELLFSGEVSLQKNETYETPWLYVAYSSEGLNGISKVFHEYVRTKIVQFPSNKPRPVHLNTWEGIYFDHNPEYIKNMATEAAAMGVERFIIDDGWFIGRSGERTALGDWYLDTKKYPDGLEPVVKHINNLGMEFGIWVEPEMISIDSDLYRAHPDWLLEIPGYNQPSGRWQYVLDLQNSDCFDYLFDRMNDLLSTYNIGYVKWDMNRELVQPAHQGKPAVHKQTLAFYALIDKIRATHPKVEIESCSSGGGRVDFEVLKRTQRFWPSDCNDALERQTIQKGMGYFFPPEVMGTHIGPKHSHTTRRIHDINLRGITALMGHMGVELDPVKESKEEKEAFGKYIKLHKKYRDLIHTGNTFRLDCTEGKRNAYGVYNTNEMLVTVCQLAMPEYSLPEPLRIAYVDDNKQYRVEIVDAPKTEMSLMKKRPEWSEKSNVFTGQILKEIGLSLPVLDPESALLIYIQAV